MKRVIFFFLFFSLLVTIFNNNAIIYAENELDTNALQLFFNKLAKMSEAKREFGALILEEYIYDGDQGIEDLKGVIDVLITEEQEKELEKYGYTVDDLKRELDRLKKWSLDDKKKLVEYIKYGNITELEALILKYETAKVEEDKNIDSDISNIEKEDELSTNESDNEVLVEVKFTDIDDNWAKDDIVFLAQRKIIKGKSEDRFDPQGYITRAEFTSLVVRLFGLKSLSEKLEFDDVNTDDWYYEDIKSAYQNGIINGIKENIFSPNENISREQVIAIIIRILEKEKLLSKLETVNRDLGLYTDKDEISPWAVETMAKALRYGLISGRTNNILAPRDYTTRAEAAKLIKKLYDILNN